MDEGVEEKVTSPEDVPGKDELVDKEDMSDSEKDGAVCICEHGEAEQGVVADGSMQKMVQKSVEAEEISHTGEIGGEAEVAIANHDQSHVSGEDGQHVIDAGGDNAGDILKDNQPDEQDVVIAAQEVDEHMEEGGVDQGVDEKKLENDLDHEVEGNKMENSNDHELDGIGVENGSNQELNGNTEDNLGHEMDENKAENGHDHEVDENKIDNDPDEVEGEVILQTQASDEDGEVVKPESNGDNISVVIPSESGPNVRDDVDNNENVNPVEDSGEGDNGIDQVQEDPVDETSSSVSVENNAEPQNSGEELAGSNNTHEEGDETQKTDGDSRKIDDEAQKISDEAPKSDDETQKLDNEMQNIDDETQKIGTEETLGTVVENDSEGQDEVTVQPNSESAEDKVDDDENQLESNALVSTEEPGAEIVPSEPDDVKGDTDENGQMDAAENIPPELEQGLEPETLVELEPQLVEEPERVLETVEVFERAVAMSGPVQVAMEPLVRRDMAVLPPVEMEAVEAQLIDEYHTEIQPHVRRSSPVKSHDIVLPSVSPTRQLSRADAAPSPRSASKFDSSMSHVSSPSRVHIARIPSPPPHIKAQMLADEERRASTRMSGKLPPSVMKMSTVMVSARKKAEKTRQASIYYEERQHRKVLSLDEAINSRPPMPFDLDGPGPCHYSPRNKPLYEDNAPEYTFGTKFPERAGGGRTAYAKTWYNSPNNFTTKSRYERRWPSPSHYSPGKSLVGGKVPDKTDFPAFSIGVRRKFTISKKGSESEPSPNQYQPQRADPVMFKRAPAFSMGCKLDRVRLFGAPEITPSPNYYSPHVRFTSRKVHYPAFTIQGVRKPKSHALGPHSTL